VDSGVLLKPAEIALMSVGWCMDAEPAPVGLTVILKLSDCFSVQHFHRIVLSSFFMLTTQEILPAWMLIITHCSLCKTFS